MTNREAALQYARNGWPIFPLWGINAARECACPKGKDCTVKPGKHPHIVGWEKVVIDLAQVEKWWSDWPDSGVALRLDFLTILDVDVHDPDKNGFESLRALEQKYGAVLDTRVKQRTGGGGEHQLFSALEDLKTAKDFAPGLDLLCDSGHYIVVEPTVHDSGNQYRWLDDLNPLTTHRAELPVEEPPQWLLRAATEPKPTKAQVKIAKALAGRKPLDDILAEALERVKAGEARHVATVSWIGIAKAVGYDKLEVSPRLVGWLDSVNALVVGKARKFTKKECEDALRWVFNKPAREEEGEDTGKKSNNIAAILEELTDDIELFHSPKGEAFALVPANEHIECRLLDSKSFKGILTYRFFKQRNSTPGREALQSFVDLLSARAIYDGPEREVYIRFAHVNGRSYLDLANDAWQVVEIDSDGWRILPHSPVPFRRVAGMKPLPQPKAGGSLTTLRRFCNLQDDKHFVLAAAWLLSCFLPRGSFPILLIMGTQGSVKSGTTSILRNVLDPASISLSALPRDERELAITCNNSGIVAFDNVSGLPAWLSDAFCRVASGAGFRTRTLTTDSDEQLFDTRRPLMLNGIDDLAARADLLDRGIGLHLRRIADGERKTDDEVQTEFADAHGGILGALLDGVSAAIRNVPTVKVASLPRMSDFARFAIAGEEGLGLEPDAFMQAYLEGRQLAAELNIENDIVAQTLLSMIQGRRPSVWEGTAKELLAVLISRAAPDMESPLGWAIAKKWPATPAEMGRWLRRAEPGLRAVDVHISEWRGRTAARVRLLRIECTGQSKLLIVPEPEAA